MPGIFSKYCGWIANAVKIVGKICNLGHRASAFLWWDGHNLRYFGSPEVINKLEGSFKCEECCKSGSYEEAAVRDSVNLAKGNTSVNVDYNISNEAIIRDLTEVEGVSILPCPLEWMNQHQCEAWMNIEIKKDFIEQKLKPVHNIPWQKVAYTPQDWPHDKWPWANASNPAKKAENPPLGGLRKVDVYQQYIRNRLASKGKFDILENSPFLVKIRQFNKVAKNVDY